MQAITPELIRRFDVSGPRYTSYPTADRFVEAFGMDDYVRALEQRRQGPAAAALARPLSIYVHLPFCESLCYYCACNKIVTTHSALAAPPLAPSRPAASAPRRIWPCCAAKWSCMCSTWAGARPSASCTWAAARPLF